MNVSRRVNAWSWVCGIGLFAYHMVAYPAASSLTWSGCGITKKAFMGEIAAAYEKKTGVKINLAGGGATKGIRMVSSKKSDVGGTCRNRLVVDGIPVGTELRTKMYQVAWDALVVITDPGNPVSNVTTADLKKIYNARISNWKELGGNDSPIQVVERAGKYTGVGQMFRVLLFGYQEHDFLVQAKEFEESGPVEEYIENTPGTLAITGVSSSKKRKVKILSLDGAAPTKENIMKGAYPLFRPLYLVSDESPSEDVMGLINFALSDEGQKIISDQGTVNLAEGKSLNEKWEQVKKKFGL